MRLFDSLAKTMWQSGSTLKNTLGWFAFAAKVQPKISFANAEVPEAPNYADLKHWAAHPQKTDKSSFKPEGVENGEEDDLGADVFFIHPTSYFGTGAWNASLDHPHANEIVDEFILPGQASVFNGCCNIYAPRYRQATFASFLGRGNNGRRALELAYEDVLTAFEHFLSQWNNGRPFFIGAHSQGAVHAMRLLEERIDKTNLSKRIVAAYVIGFRFPLEKFEKGYFQNLRPAESARDTGCVVAWDTYSEDGKPYHWLDKAEVWYDDSKRNWKPRAFKTPLCINPLNWKITLEKAGKEKNLGAVHSVLSDRDEVNWNGWGGEEVVGLNTTGLSAPYPGEVSAQKKKDGFLYVSTPESEPFKRLVMPGGNYHNYDYALFYMNMRENIKDRFEAYSNNNTIMPSM